MTQSLDITLPFASRQSISCNAISTPPPHRRGHELTNTGNGSGYFSDKKVLRIRRARVEGIMSVGRGHAHTYVHTNSLNNLAEALNIPFEMSRGDKSRPALCRALARVLFPSITLNDRPITRPNSTPSPSAHPSLSTAVSDCLFACVINVLLSRGVILTA